jgi:hypothetical protein
MKSSIEKTATPNKRSQVLKSILEKQNGVDAADDKSLRPTVQNIQEDLIASASQTVAPMSNTKIISFNTEVDHRDTEGGANMTQSTLPQSIELFYSLMKKELAKAATGLGIDEAELKAWIDLQIDVPAKTILTVLRMMQSLNLDPLLEEIGLAQYEDGQWHVFITIEGCAKLLNQHPQFNGLLFNQANTLIEGVPEWIECSIYRKDRELPTTVREYYIEVKGETAIWQKMPRRILRHRALQQCVRLAMT